MKAKITMTDGDLRRQGELWQITASRFCAGFVVERGRIVTAAPILKWMLGKVWGPGLISYIRRKGWTAVQSKEWQLWRCNHE